MLTRRKTLINLLLLLLPWRVRAANFEQIQLGSSGGVPSGDGIISEAGIQIDSEIGVDMIAET